jgi:hypothetical protein
MIAKFSSRPNSRLSILELPTRAPLNKMGLTTLRLRVIT